MRSLNESNSVVSTTAHFNPSNKPKGLLRVFKALKNSLRAFSWLTKNEAAFKQELSLAAVAFVVLAFWSIPFLIKDINPNYKFMFAHHSPVEWESVIYAY